MIKLTDILKEIKINDPSVFVNENDVSISGVILDFLFAWVGGESDLGFVTGHDITSLEMVYNTFKEYDYDDEFDNIDLNYFTRQINKYVNKIIVFKREDSIVYLVVKPGGIVGVDSESAYNDAVRSGLPVEEQMIDNALYYLYGKSKKLAQGEVNLENTNYTLYKLYIKGSYRPVDRNGAYSFEKEYYFVYPDDKVMTLDNIYQGVHFWGIDPLFVRNDVNNKSYEIDIEDKELTKYKDITISQPTYNMLVTRYHTRRDRIEPIIYNEEWVNHISPDAKELNDITT